MSRELPREELELWLLLVSKKVPKSRSGEGKERQTDFASSSHRISLCRERNATFRLFSVVSW